MHAISRLSINFNIAKAEVINAFTLIILSIKLV